MTKKIKSIPSLTKGLTLIELVVVIVIILVLISFAIERYSNFSTKAAREGALVSLKSIAQAMKMYKVEKGRYPTVVVPDLQPYVNLTTLLTSFVNNSVIVYSHSTARCVAGAVKDLTPLYNVNYCVKAGPDNRTKLENQPSCCWLKGGVNCTNPANWYPCSEKM